MVVARTHRGGVGCFCAFKTFGFQAEITKIGVIAILNSECGGVASQAHCRRPLGYGQGLNMYLSCVKTSKSCAGMRSTGTAANMKLT